MTILALTGGVGGAKLSLGLAEILSPDQVTFLVNVGDDFEHIGLKISPDIDTLTYTLAGTVNESTGWGRADETWTCLSELARFGGDTWFQLGDRDLALHLFRTHALNNGRSLTQITQSICESLNVQHKVAPVTDDTLQTQVDTDQGTLAFQDYFVRLKCEPQVTAIRYIGSETARLTSAVDKHTISGVVICPSNPFLSIDPVLAVSELRQLLLNRTFPVIAVSPIVGQQAIKGPTAKMMAELKMPVSCVAVADRYRDLIDGFIFDQTDAHAMPEIESLGIQGKTSQTIMRTLEDKAALAQLCADFLTELRTDS